MDCSKLNASWQMSFGDLITLLICFFICLVPAGIKAGSKKDVAMTKQDGTAIALNVRASSGHSSDGPRALEKEEESEGVNALQDALVVDSCLSLSDSWQSQAVSWGQIIDAWGKGRSVEIRTFDCKQVRHG